MKRLLVVIAVASPMLCASSVEAQVVDPTILEGLRRHVPPEHPLQDDSPPNEIIEARLRIASRQFNAALDRVFPSSSLSKPDRTAVSSLLEWSTKCMEARLEAADRDSDRKVAYAIEAARFRKIEGLVLERLRGPAASFSAEDADRVAFHRLGLDLKQATLGR